MSKYHSKKTEIDGIKFDSKKEAERYKSLCLREKAGEIDRVEVHPKFRLLPSQRFDLMDNERPLDYVADFMYRERKSGYVIIEDVKGVKTKDYIVKRKLFKYMFPDYIFREVT